SRRCSFLSRPIQWRRMLVSFSFQCTGVETSARSSWWSATHSRVRQRGRFLPPSCLTQTTSPGQRSTAASSALIRMRGKRSAAW
ncbi:hypothetical protein LDENG_00146600, partial [Lucifuga dentata]